MRNLLTFCLLSICINQSIAAQCQSINPPMIIRNEPNWNFKIDKENTITTPYQYTLNMALDFYGNNLRYSYKVKDTPLNDIRLNSKTGQLDFRTDFPERLDMTVTATNDCGSAEMSFKVNIIPANLDEETVNVS